MHYKRVMQTQKVITSVRLDRALVERLDAVGEKVDRSRNWLTATAIAEYLARHEENSRGSTSRE
jgi:predicted transcriptional regulator